MPICLRDSYDSNIKIWFSACKELIDSSYIFPGGEGRYQVQLENEGQKIPFIPIVNLSVLIFNTAVFQEFSDLPFDQGRHILSHPVLFLKPLKTASFVKRIISNEFRQCDSARSA